MTVATQFDSWQSGGKTPGPPWTGSANVRALMAFLRLAYGGTNLGSNVNVRPIVGGSSWSDHAFGAGGDWGYGNGIRPEQDHGGPGRDFVVEELIPWLIANSLELGLQRIHDYIRKSIWQAGRGWGGNPGTGYYWLHNSTHPLAYTNGIPILDRPGISRAPGGVAPPEVDWAEIARIDAEMRAVPYPGTPVRRVTPIVKRREVEAIQWMLIVNGEPISCDGLFGPKTEEAVKRFQTAQAIFIDGIVGPTTWARLGLAPASGVPQPPPPPPSAPAPIYVVQAGDSFWRIAERTLWSGPAYVGIANDNGGASRVLRVGEAIVVRGARHTKVQSGDGWISVANRLGRDMHQVRERNAWQGSMLHPGMTIWGGAA